MNFYLQPEQPTSSYSRLDSGDYELIVRQQPREALITQPGKEKNRKPIDPPPIVQLKVPEVKDPIRQFLQSPYLFMICHLEAGDPEMDAQEAKEALSGSISSSLHRLKDINNEDGGFFVFGDISVKTAGRHRLRFTLMELQKEENRVVTLRSTLSEPFNVVPPKHWRGLEESTYLSRAFSDQGVRLRLRKENRTMAQKRNYQSFQDAQPGPSSVAGDQQSGSVYNASPASSHYGFDNLPKRQRSGDYSQQAMYATGERGAPGYATREFNSSMSSVTGYPVQAAGPRHSPQTPYGFQQAAAGPNLPSYYPQGQTVPSMRAIEPNTRQTQSATPAGSFTYQTGSMNTDPSEYFPRRPLESYSSIQHTPAMTPTLGSTPTDAYQGAGQPMYANPAGPATGSSAASMYQHSNVPSPMGPATGGSSTSVHTPASARGSALNPSAQPFAQNTLPSQQLPYHLQSQQLPSQQMPSQGYGSLPEAQQYSYDRTAAQHYTQQQQQSLQHTPPTTLQHLTQALPAPHQQRPPESGDPYGQHWQQYDS